MNCAATLGCPLLCETNPGPNPQNPAAISAATRDVTDDRGYPFFLFAPAAVRDLVGAPTGAT